MNPTITFIRHRAGDPLLPRDRQFGPKDRNHPSIGSLCTICRRPFVVGDTTTLLPLGPNDFDAEEVAKAKDGRYYNACAVEIHWSCAGHAY